MLVVARWLHFASIMTLFGSTFYVAILAPEGVAAELAPPLRRAAVWLAAVALASAALWFVLVAKAMSGDLDALGEVATETAFGRVWLVRGVALALLLLATWFPDRRWRLPALLSGFCVASLGWVGHAAAQDGAVGLAHRINHAAHLLLVSGWLGGLPPFLLCLAQFRMRPDRRDALAAMMRYSRVGHVAVAAVFATGAIDVALTSHALPWPPNTAYRLGLCVKVAIFSVMVAMALVNRYVFAPRIGQAPGAAHLLAAGAIAELCFGAAAVADASLFATFDPN